MTSNTSDFTEMTKTSESVLTRRNAVSTTKRKIPRRKIIKISPLRSDQIQKELEEAANEPSWSQQNLINKENEPQNDSFDMNFVPFAPTPRREIAPKKEVVFATPLTDLKRNVKPPSAVAASDHFTPNHRAAAPLKVQCSVEVSNYLKASRIPRDKGAINGKLQLRSPLTSKQIRVNGVEYVVINELGHGGSSKVFYCYNPETNTSRAIKSVSLDNPSSAEGFIKEVHVLKTLQKCDRIIKMYDFEINEASKTLFVVLEVGGADLSKILKESAHSSTHMPQYKLLYYWMEMLYAVKQIHSNGIVHSDLKPANFLKVNEDLKLIDFGISSCIQQDMTSVFKTVTEGTMNYISPEALKNESSGDVNSPSCGKAKYKISFKSDVWSLGCILYQLVYRKTPFQHIKAYWEKISTLMNPNHKIEYPQADWVSPKFINTMKKCLQYEMRLRPSIDELIHEYEHIL